MNTEVEKPPTPEHVPSSPPHKSQINFAFKLLKQNIMTALEETETTLANLCLLEQAESIPADLSEQDLMIMEETAQVRSKVARQLIKSLKSYKQISKPDSKDGQTDSNLKGDFDGHLTPLKLSNKLSNMPYHKMHKCKLCRSRFHKQSHLKCHIRLSHYKLSFVCSKCHNHFQSKQRLKHHRCPVEDDAPDQEDIDHEDHDDHDDHSPRSHLEEYRSSHSVSIVHPQNDVIPIHSHIPTNEDMKYDDDTESHHDGEEPPQEHEISQHEHQVMRHPSDEDMVSPKIKPSPSQSNTSGASSRSAHTSTEDSPKGRDRNSSGTPASSPEDNENAPRDYRNGSVPANPLMRAPNLPYMPEVNYYLKDSPDSSRDQHRTFFQHRPDLRLPPLPLHRFDTAFGNPLPSISLPRPSQPPDGRAQYENGSLSNLPSPIPTTQPLQSFLGKGVDKNLPLLNNLNIQKNNAFISQLIAASCIPTASSTPTTNIFTSQTTPTSVSAFPHTAESGSSSTSPTQLYQPPPPPTPPSATKTPHTGQPQSSEQNPDNTNSLNQFLDYKKYSCKICHRKFSQRSSLNRHVYTIHWNMKIKCAFCTKTYTQKCLLKQHVYEEHGVEACLQMFSANERINWKMQLVNSQKQRLNMPLDDEDTKSMKQETSST